jgi:ABC-type polysaccharide/polyol phosphate transport system ATPase subunit
MSSSDLAVSVKGLSKAYTISHGQEKHVTLAETVLSRLKNVFKRQNRETFWALKDISFDINKGDVVGIIGRNGAGKSTLLKVLSRITEPTAGEIDVYGRVGSLLEVGTGFHPELTGRENIFLNGAILGMGKAEIRRQFDAIVDFSGVETFLDTPVKRYSSGMYVRLAFAVAAHLNPEILIVDEVLAVGDSQFQEKCIGKMSEVSRSGRTVLFISHNMLAIQKLCTRGILMEAGRLKFGGAVEDVVAAYLSTGTSDSYSCAPNGKHPQITSARVLTLAPRTDSVLEIGLEWVLPQRVRGIKVGVGFNAADGQRIFDFAPEDEGSRIPEEAGHYKAVFRIPANTLMARNYGVSIGLWSGSVVYDHANPALRIAMEAAPIGPYSHEGTREGLVNIPCGWQLFSQSRSLETVHE